jgi:hypothetical protein
VSQRCCSRCRRVRAVAALFALGALDMISISSGRAGPARNAMRCAAESAPSTIFISPRTSSASSIRHHRGLVRHRVAVLIGGIGTLVVVGLWMWFPALRKRDALHSVPA